MNIIIVGCGKVGVKLADELSREGHDIAVINADPERFKNLSADFNGITITGTPIDQYVLKKAGIESCDFLAAMTEDDNTNIVISQIAKELFNVPRVLARVFDPQRENVFSHFGLTTVCPTNLTISAIKSIVTENNKPQFVSFANATMRCSTITPEQEHIGLHISSLEFNGGETVVGIINEDNKLISPVPEHASVTENMQLVVVNLIK